jgi:hypothetical protein
MPKKTTTLTPLVWTVSRDGKTWTSSRDDKRFRIVESENTGSTRYELIVSYTSTVGGGSFVPLQDFDSCSSFEEAKESAELGLYES